MSRGFIGCSASASNPGKSASSRSWNRRSVSVVCLLSCTRPSPRLRNLHQASSHRIVLHIRNQRPQFLLCPNPVIVRFILPKRQASAAQDIIRHARRAPLNPSHHRGKAAAKLPNHVDMIRHEHPGVEVIKIAAGLSKQKRVSHHLRNASIRQPARPVRLAWQRSGQPPRNGKHGVVRNPMREMSPIKKHSGLSKRQTTENRWSVIRFTLVVRNRMNSR